MWSSSATAATSEGWKIGSLPSPTLRGRCSARRDAPTRYYSIVRPMLLGCRVRQGSHGRCEFIDGELAGKARVDRAIGVYEHEEWKARRSDGLAGGPGYIIRDHRRGPAFSLEPLRRRIVGLPGIRGGRQRHQLHVFGHSLPVDPLLQPRDLYLAMGAPVRADEYNLGDAVIGHRYLGSLERTSRDLRQAHPHRRVPAGVRERGERVAFYRDGSRLAISPAGFVNGRRWPRKDDCHGEQCDETGCGHDPYRRSSALA